MHQRDQLEAALHERTQPASPLGSSANRRTNDGLLPAGEPWDLPVPERAPDGSNGNGLVSGTPALQQGTGVPCRFASQDAGRGVGVDSVTGRRSAYGDD